MFDCVTVILTEATSSLPERVRGGVQRATGRPVPKRIPITGGTALPLEGEWADA